MAAVSDRRFQYTATGLLGNKRDTMLENQLLLRNELGKPSRRGYRGYPGDEERYGRPNLDGQGGAAVAMGGWAGGSSSSAQAGLHFTKRGGGDAACGNPGRDFKALNKSAVQAGLVTASEQYQYRGTHDIRMKVQPDAGETGAGTKSATRRLPPSMVFGISTRPSTPIHDLLEHRYQDQWLAERRSADLAQKQHTQLAQKSGPGKLYETRASLLRIHQIPVNAAPLWKLPKFSKHAKASLNTFRTEPVQRSAYSHKRLDGIPRQGTFGLGIYEPAKC